ncbi:hypothetical protein [Nitrincola tapanii]|uniref:Uncharacterized protein n=1 Tax=Nitrincola tapanii TaxID=1708751 RepID=A0A5A9W290_9GAMM|nr:hypothetical protein [Nitrincola tapanii]KAA0874218.1 hypothetical protein E1H14_10630 [Nitrincola tapanii]
MSIGFYATLAGDRLDLANQNAYAADSWRNRAEELEQALDTPMSLTVNGNAMRLTCGSAL